MTLFALRTTPIYQREEPVRDPAYKRFIKSLPCVGCLKRRWIDPAHTGPHGLGQKASDLNCIPLCRTCHQEYDTNPQAFVEKRKLDIPGLIQMFNAFYQRIKGRQAA